MPDVTAQLLGVYRCDQRIDGLKSRLRAAERFLGEQVKQLDEIGKRRQNLDGQLRQLKAAAANEEGESSRLNARIDELKAQMNTAETNKQYQAFLGEVKTLEAARDRHDAAALEHLEKAEAVQAQLDEIGAAEGERTKVRSVAEGDRSKRADEIKDKLAELEAERDRLAGLVPGHALAIYEELRQQRGEDAMAPLEVVDRKRQEYICGSSMMSVPAEVANKLLLGELTLSPNDGCILYLTDEVFEALQPAAKK